jgi:hypothetical protein
MALKDKKSLYDRNTRNVLGDTVGTEPPSDGTYFQADGNTVSPFGVERGLKSDQMVELLNKSINTSTGNAYIPSNLDRPGVDVDRSPQKYEDRLPS